MNFKAFSIRNIKELLRDPLSYIFCLGFPIVMLIIMTVVNSGIPKEANMEIFKIQNLAPGIATFTLTFIMLFTCLQVSKDRSSAFLTRLYASPMKASDFILGYTIPLIFIALSQIIITFIASFIIGLFTNYTFNLGNIIISVIILLPSIILYIGFGLLFGTLLNEKAAPGLSSIIITVSGILGGIWMDVSVLTGSLKSLCTALPFYHGVEAARMAVSGNFSSISKSLIIVSLYAILIFILSILVFNNKMKKDLS